MLDHERSGIGGESGSEGGVAFASKGLDHPLDQIDGGLPDRFEVGLGGHGTQQPRLANAGASADREWPAGTIGERGDDPGPDVGGGGHGPTSVVPGPGVGQVPDLVRPVPQAEWRGTGRLMVCRGGR